MRGLDAMSTEWVDIRDVDLAFDHARIFADANELAIRPPISSSMVPTPTRRYTAWPCNARMKDRAGIRPFPE